MQVLQRFAFLVLLSLVIVTIRGDSTRHEKSLKPVLGKSVKSGSDASRPGCWRWRLENSPDPLEAALTWKEVKDCLEAKSNELFEVARALVTTD